MVEWSYVIQGVIFAKSSGTYLLVFFHDAETETGIIKLAAPSQLQVQSPSYMITDFILVDLNCIFLQELVDEYAGGTDVSCNGDQCSVTSIRNE